MGCRRCRRSSPCRLLFLFSPLQKHRFQPRQIRRGAACALSGRLGQRSILGGGEEAGIGSGRGGWARARERDRGGLEEAARVRVGEAPPWRSADWGGMEGRDWGEATVLFPDLGFHRRAKGRAHKQAGGESLSVGSTRAWPHSSSAQTEKMQVTK
jgi:hypothetical protein